ncbi:glycosyltransferase family 2 protein [Flavobacterium sp. XS2P39]|uniref:glycosyltransferase family 2 protein n=1 Tax=Flavobacterium sp. XS2P39 TaxID=3401725 RepID=UPI003AAAD5AA
MNKMKISACIITYNHENFIRECLEGAINQSVNFEYEIVIGEDNSSDKTREICCEYAEKYPNLIKFFPREKNIGMIGNWTKTIQNCQGKYIALCEGDDYWTDPLKLQKQVDFLEANADYVICFHKVDVLQDGVIEEETITAKVPETTSINDLAKGNYMHTCSVVYRNNLFSELPEYFNQSPVGDYFLHLLNARYGAIRCFDEIMGVYRVHGTSVWSSKTQEERESIWVPFLKNIKPNFDKEVQDVLNAQIAFYTKSEEKKDFVWNARNIKNKIIQKLKRLIQLY